jgi:ABC-type transport system involved in multi-copper enzyme maturation permease subunit
MLRKRVLVLTLLMTVIFLVAFWFVAKTLGGEAMTGIDPDSGEALIGRFMRGSFILMLGFFFGAFVIAFLAIFSSFSAIAGEAEQGVLQALLPRPIPRWKWYVGRWLGYVTLGIGYALILYIAILVITDIHATIPQDSAALVQSFLLFSSSVPLLITVSMLGSGFLSALGNGVFMTMLYGAGWLGGMIEKLSGSLGLDPAVTKPLYTIAGTMSLVMPADALQRKMLAILFSFDELSGMVPFNNSQLSIFAVGQVPSTTFIIYAALYTAAAFLFGLLRFNKKDF